jgi:hypothetical protein
MNVKVKRVLLLLLAALLLLGLAPVQSSMDRDRDRLGLTRIQPLENAPPMLAFTTVALGGFRGLISNALWIRAGDLQENDKFFEMVQLADWITKLEPHFVQVWLVQAWNMAYNISVKFKDYPDRWRWVERGIELLRDDGLRYNPDELLIYRELAWFFQHKMGANLDDAHMYYKEEWLREMSNVFGGKKPNLEELIHPQTEDQRTRAKLLRDKYKMDPEFMKDVDARFGPLEWRLPESSAIYWAALGLEKARQNPNRVNKDDLITLRRVVYQSMQLSFQRGRLISNPFDKRADFGPNLDIIPKVSAAYEQAAEEDKNYHDHILRAHKNFLRDAVYFLYENNRMKEANYWFKYLGEKYPEERMLDNKPASRPRNLTLDEYAVQRLQEDVGDMSRERTRAALEGMLATSYRSLITDGEEERATGLMLLAQKLWNAYDTKIQQRYDPLKLPTLDVIAKDVQGRLLDPKGPMPFEMRATLRTRLRLPPESATPPASPSAPTNAPPETAEKVAAGK